MIDSGSIVSFALCALLACQRAFFVLLIAIVWMRRLVNDWPFGEWRISDSAACTAIRRKAIGM